MIDKELWINNNSNSNSNKELALKSFNLINNHLNDFNENL
jgi:hypothetical protein